MPTSTLTDQLQTLPRTRTALLPALLIAQSADGFVSDEALQAIARHTRVSVNEAEGVATAYPEIRRTPSHLPLVRVCTGESCRCAGAARVLDAATLAAGSTYEVEPVACFFLCGVGPIVEIAGERRGRIAPEAVRDWMQTGEIGS